MSDKTKLACCDFCGRDTTHKSRICRHCAEPTPRDSGWDELSGSDKQRMRELHQSNYGGRDREIEWDVEDAVNGCLGVEDE